MKRLYLRGMVDTQHHVSEMGRIGVCEDGIRIMSPKFRQMSFLVRKLDPKGANILKQEMLSAGGEAAISYHALSDLSRPTDVLLIASEKQYDIIIDKLKQQPFGLKELALELEQAIGNLTQPRVRIIDLGERTLIMGVLNVTPDSFSDGGRFASTEAAVLHANRMAKDGADIIDVGGESTRPGAEPIELEEELERVIPVIEALAGEPGIPISIDSRKPEVVERAVEAGATMVNLIGGLRDDKMAKVLAKANVPTVLMHMQGEPDTMQADPKYEDVMDDIVDSLAAQMARAVGKGLKQENIIVDPGIGFGKTAEHSMEIIRRLGELRLLGAPIMVGTSRKSFIGKVSGGGVDDRLEGSLASAVVAVVNHADMIRAHDVKETRRALEIADAIMGKG